MAKSGRPKKDFARLTVHIPPELKKQLMLERIERGKTISEIVVEALGDRTVVYTRKGESEQ